MPNKMDADVVRANKERALKEASDYRTLHATVIAEIMDALRPLRSYKKTTVNCPCGTRDVIYCKMPQHISSKKHRRVFETPTLEDFAGVIKPKEMLYSAEPSVAFAFAPPSHLGANTNPSAENQDH